MAAVTAGSTAAVTAASMACVGASAADARASAADVDITAAAAGMAAGTAVIRVYGPLATRIATIDHPSGSRRRAALAALSRCGRPGMAGNLSLFAGGGYGKPDQAYRSMMRTPASFKRRIADCLARSLLSAIPEASKQTSKPRFKPPFAVAATQPDA